MAKRQTVRTPFEEFRRKLKKGEVKLPPPLHPYYYPKRSFWRGPRRPAGHGRAQARRRRAFQVSPERLFKTGSPQEQHDRNEEQERRKHEQLRTNAIRRGERWQDARCRTCMKFIAPPIDTPREAKNNIQRYNRDLDAKFTRRQRGGMEAYDLFKANEAYAQKLQENRRKAEKEWEHYIAHQKRQEEQYAAWRRYYWRRIRAIKAAKMGITSNRTRTDAKNGKIEHCSCGTPVPLAVDGGKKRIKNAGAEEISFCPACSCHQCKKRSKKRRERLDS